MTSKHTCEVDTRPMRFGDAWQKKRSCPFSSKKSFNQECAAILAASDKGSYYNQQEWLEEVEEHVNNREVSEQTVDQMSASCAKIQLKESVGSSVFYLVFHADFQ